MATTPQNNRPVTPNDLRELNEIFKRLPGLGQRYAEDYPEARDELVAVLAERIAAEERFHATMNLDMSRTAEQKADTVITRYERSSDEQINQARATSDRLMRELSPGRTYEWVL